MVAQSARTSIFLSKQNIEKLPQDFHPFFYKVDYKNLSTKIINIKLAEWQYKAIKKYSKTQNEYKEITPKSIFSNLVKKMWLTFFFYVFLRV